MARTATTKTKTELENNNLEKENAELREQLSAMMDMIKELQSKQNGEKTVTLQDEFRRRVTITSISTGGVNLRTNTTGSAKPFRLER